MKKDVILEKDVIFNKVEQFEKAFEAALLPMQPDHKPKKPKKFSGALMVEVLKSHLERNGLSVSNRDVFINGVDSEIDLLIIQKDANPQYGLIYEPDDVIAAFEIKRRGSFGEKGISTIRTTFEKIRSKNGDVFCCYITLLERENYKWRITSEKLGYPAYTFFFYKGEDEQSKFTTEECGDWNEFLDELKKLLTK